MADDDRISTDLQIRMLEKKLAELEGEGAGRGKSGSGKSSFKPPKAGKVPGGKGGHGGGGKVSIKMKGGGKAPKSPKAPEPRPVSAQQRALAGMGRDADASRRFLPAGGSHKSGHKKRKGA